MKHSLGFCLLCHNYNWLDNYLCPLCQKELNATLCSTLSPFNCLRCGAPLLQIDSLCHCSGTDPLIVRVGVYTKAMQQIIIRYKRNGIKALAYPLAALLALYLERYENLIIVPVPCSKASRRVRGWDQMIFVAKILTRLTPHTLGLLLGRRGHIAQKDLPRARRLTVAPTSYYVKERQLRLCAHTIDSCDALVVIDDVMTTGATLSTCIEKLKVVIPKPIFGLCLAMD